MTDPHDSPFDRLLHDLQHGDMALADGKRIKREGEPGARRAQFQMEQGEYDEGMLTSPGWLIETMASDLGIRSDSLLDHKQLHEYGTTHHVIVGQWSQGGWGLMVKGDIDEQGNAMGSCQVVLMEGQAQVRHAIDTLETHTMSRTVMQIVAVLEHNTGMDPAKLLRLREYLAQDPRGAKLLSVWDAAATGQALEQSADTVSRARPGAGRL